MHVNSARLLVGLGLLTAGTLLTGCNATDPVKTAGLTPTDNTTTASAAPEKSIQEIADEAMHSTGKLTKAQINALIRANAKCSPTDPAKG